MKKAVQFGAGNIGRGFLAQLFFESGFETVFVEAREDIVRLLNERKSYPLKIVGEHAQSILIENVRAVWAEDKEKVCEEIRDACLLATAVGADNLKNIASLIARGLIERINCGNTFPLDIIIAENLVNAGEVFKGYILESLRNLLKHRNLNPLLSLHSSLSPFAKGGLRGISGGIKGDLALMAIWEKEIEKNLGFVEAVISRMVPAPKKEDDPLLIRAEAYKELPVDKNGFKAEIPRIKGIIPLDNFAGYVERKCWTHNAGHSIAAYCGYQKGYTYIYEAINDEEIKEIVLRAILDESGQALIRKHNFSPLDYQNHVRDLIQRFSNVALGDTIARVARNPIRKLGPEERLIGGARLALQYGITPGNFIKGIICALKYDHPEDQEAKELVHLLKARGLDYILTHICGLSPEDKLYCLLQRAWT